MVALSASARRPAFGPRAVGFWLLAVAALIAAMVIVGGLTRLTGSGLSITEWHPVTGVVPPLGERAWADEFAKYQQIPQYRLEHPDMSLSDFKTIYWWEWSHRLLGRVLGVAFLLPFAVFVFAGTIPRTDYLRMLGLFALGGLQGFVGWWMVESGLETRVSVSQYRLAIHLGVAIILLGAILWAALDYLRAAAKRDFFPPPRAGEVASVARRRGRDASVVPPSALCATPPAGEGRKHWNWSLAFIALVYVQMLLGALVAGLHAGFVYNTWPSMNGHLLPEHPFFFQPWWTNFGENAGLVQFDHRIGAYLVAIAAMALWTSGRRLGLGPGMRLSGDVLLGVVGLQIVLGIATLLNQAPLPLAALHQATAVALYGAAVWHAHELRPMSPPAPDPDLR